VYVGWAGTSLTFDGSACGQLVNDPCLKQILSAVRALGETQMPEKRRKLFNHAWSMAGIAWKHPVALGMTAAETKASEKGSLEGGVLLIDLGEDREAFNMHLNAVVQILAEEHSVTEQTVGEVAYKVIKGDGCLCDPGIALGFIGDMFFLLPGDEAVRELIELTPEKSLSTNKAFTDCWKEVGGENEQLAFYVAVPRLLEKIESFVSPPTTDTQPTTQSVSEIGRAIRALGLEKATALVGCTRIVDRGMYTRARVFTPAPHRGILTPLSGCALTDADLSGVPQDAEFATAIKLSPELLYAEILNCLRIYSAGATENLADDFSQAVARIEEDLGISLTADVLPFLGDCIVISGASSQGGYLTGTIVSISVKDTEKLSQAMAKIEDYCRDKISKTAQTEEATRIETFKVDRTEIHYLSGSCGFPMPIAPAWAIHKDRLYIAAFPQVIANLIGKNGGGGSLAAEANFRKVREKISAGPSAICYVNTPKIIRQMYPTFLLLWTLCANAMDEEISLDPKPHWLPALSTLEECLWPEINAVSSDERGITFESYGALPGTGTVLAGSPLGASAAFIVPSLIGSRRKAKHAVSSANLNGIGKGIYFYIEEHDWELPPDLDALVRDDLIPAGILVSPLARREPPKLVDGKLVGEIDYVYIKLPPKLTDVEKPHETIMAYERPENFGGRGTNVLFVSGRVKFLKTSQFQELLKRTNQYVKSCEGGEDF
jgi:hypothetical protein